jgi:uncharacterized protein (DUF924 family)/Ca2+-binding EF-hand superfamily protein
MMNQLDQDSAASGGTAVVQEMLARDFEQNVPIRNNRYHFKVYRNTFVGREAVDYLIFAGYAKDRLEATALGRELCQVFNLFEHVCRDHELKDEFLFYRFTDPSVRRHGGASVIDAISLSNRSGPPLSDVTDWTVDRLKNAAAKLRKMEIKDRKYRLKNYPKCFVASEAVDFLVGSEIVDRRSDAVLLGRRLQAELGSFHHVVYEHDFRDEYIFFRWKSDTKDLSTESQSDRSPEAVLDFWLGPLREPADMNEENWRNRMNQWRVGCFVGGESAGSHFRRYQKDWCDRTCMGVKVSIFDGWETNPYGALAKLIILDQFPRTIYQGTPLAFGKQTEVAALVETICVNKWDEQVYNVLERMWVYMAAEHIEDQDMQDLSIAKWTKWTQDMLAVSNKENKDINRKVSTYFLKGAVEHAEAAVWYGRFPHLNSVYNRPNSYPERKYLLSKTRPPWTMKQPVDPEFQALHAIIHRIAPGDDCDCNELPKLAIVKFDEYFNLDGELIPVLFRGGKKSVTFSELYAHLRQSTKISTMMEIRSSRRLIKTQQEICQIVYQDEITVWPPIFSEIPKVLDISKLNSLIGCPFLVAPARLKIPWRAIREFQHQSGFLPEPITMIYSKHLKLISATKTKRQSPSEDAPGLRDEAVLDKDHFRGVFGPMLSRNQGATLDQLFDLVDAGNNKVLDYSELYVPLIVFGTGSVAQKARLTASYFDSDGDNRLSRDDLINLFEACFLRCPAFLSSLFQGNSGGVATDDSDDENAPVTVENVQTLRKAQDLGETCFTQLDSDQDGLVALDAFVAWLQMDGDSSGNVGTGEARDLFLRLFLLSDALFTEML